MLTLPPQQEKDLKDLLAALDGTSQFGAPMLDDLGVQLRKAGKDDNLAAMIEALHDDSNRHVYLLVCRLRNFLRA